jgi:hypothetical protein
MKTLLHHYSFDLTDPEQKAEHEAMAAHIESQPGIGRPMKCIDTSKWDKELNKKQKNYTAEQIELETKHLFDNQWNSTTDRVFDWYEPVNYSNGREITTVKYGHYLTITQEMIEARNSTTTCGYCGAQYGPFHEKASGEFCDKCLDSPYLKQSDLHLLRLMPVSFNRSRKLLTKDESAILAPLYIERQTVGSSSRAVAKRNRQRQDAIDKAAESIKSAEDKRDGVLWLLDHNFDVDNVIYYKHTNSFCFGWRSPLEEAVADRLLQIISEFPFDYEIKQTNGKTYERVS